MTLGPDIAIASASPKRAGKSEDRAEIFRHDDAVVVVVADGAGGMRGGAAASDALVEAIRARVAGEGFDAYEPGGWIHMLEQVDASLARSMGGETTAVLVLVGEHRSAHGASEQEAIGQWSRDADHVRSYIVEWQPAVRGDRRALQGRRCGSDPRALRT